MFEERAERKKKPEPEVPPPPLERANKNWVTENPNDSFPYEDQPEPQQFTAPPTFVGDPMTGRGHLTIAERRISHREALEQKYKEYQFQRKQQQLSGLRAFYG